MSDGAMCFYCRRYRCICEEVKMSDNPTPAAIAEMPERPKPIVFTFTDSVRSYPVEGIHYSSFQRYANQAQRREDYFKSRAERAEALVEGMVEALKDRKAWLKYHLDKLEGIDTSSIGKKNGYAASVVADWDLRQQVEAVDAALESSRKEVEG